MWTIMLHTYYIYEKAYIILLLWIEECCSPCLLGIIFFIHYAVPLFQILEEFKRITSIDLTETLENGWRKYGKIIFSLKPAKNEPEIISSLRGQYQSLKMDEDRFRKYYNLEFIFILHKQIRKSGNHMQEI